MEEVDTQESWNKKRIFIAVFLFILLIAGGYLFKIRFLDEYLSQQAKSVKGVGTAEKITEPAFKTNIQEALKEKINNLKQEVSGLNISEIASSSPQVQKILKDIKSLEQYPTNQIKEICRKICGL
ncbi:MAG: hypothetical protein A3B47_01225 [Candidatus Levybacteria bacterium RIFCSPLOWO2_01_FULL_39_24]|nr:MAG: hypothetical protein A2800_03260 [Candidatus Levybacteria bacterium RIFCSPHIGHO2_01_FULL_40_16]OGH28610.1 MAG: hypothetical protein A3E12_03160 [Candidatus Levybacteria bacterium RIFCSPHIGHO2_12_FULL_39_9]OGH45999.1 MAG: hypothetical protein A3B47_01225 [Candidatus Levybacteria bacterium RIFCSPLOWO2_01_FULL_39_24]